MKKIIGMLSLMMVLFLSVSVSAQAPDTIYFSKSVMIQANGQMVYEAKEGENVFTAEITNPGTEKTEITVYAVAYKVENGVKTLLDVDGQTKEIGAGKAEEFSATLNITKEADQVSFFTFCNGNLAPVTQTLSVEYFGIEEDNISVYKINHF